LLLELAFKVVGGSRGDGVAAEGGEEVDDVLAVGEEFIQQRQQRGSLGGCQQGGEKGRVVHGGVLSRGVRK
jgi:hypothetical protein